jgi:hypothetical protein
MEGRQDGRRSGQLSRNTACHEECIQLESLMSREAGEGREPKLENG